MNFKIKFSTIVLFLFILKANAQINWQDGQPTGTKWAFACDFKNSDLIGKSTTGADCARTCQSTSGCTHFSWTPSSGSSGTCWMKSKIGVSQNDAFYNGNTGMVCGIIPGGI